MQHGNAADVSCYFKASYLAGEVVCSAVSRKFATHSPGVSSNIFGQAGNGTSM